MKAMKADVSGKTGVLSSDLLWWKGFQASLKGMKAQKFIQSNYCHCRPDRQSKHHAYYALCIRIADQVGNDKCVV